MLDLERWFPSALMSFLFTFFFHLLHLSRIEVKHCTERLCGILHKRFFSELLILLWGGLAR